MTNNYILPYTLYGREYGPVFEGYNDEQYRIALEIGTANYEHWLRRVVAERERAKMKVAASLADQLERDTPAHPSNKTSPSEETQPQPGLFV